MQIVYTKMRSRCRDSWYLTPVGGMVLFAIGRGFAQELPATALVVGLFGVAAIAVIVGAMLFIFRR